MTSRSANATIKGYFYQFDHAIFQLLSITDENQVITIEGVEDVDINSADFEQLIQCKYYEQSEYNHSVIKPAIIEMLKHFKIHSEAKFKYKLYGYYKSGQDKLDLPLTLDFLKNNFLKFEEKGVLHKVWEELSLNDTELSEFIKLLEIDNQAISYDGQLEQINDIIKRKIDNSTDEDVESFYYPLALNVIRKLAIQANIEDRKIDVKTFLANINIKNKIFDNWHITYLGEEKYKKYLNKEYFSNSGSTATLKAARFFVIEYDSTVNLSVYLECIKKISDKFSNKEHRSTLDKDRFCPYLYIQNIDASTLIKLKKQLKSIGVSFIDGFGFLGDDFDVARICTAPNKDNKIKLKLLNTVDEFNQAIDFKHNQSLYLFEFYFKTTTDTLVVNENVNRSKIKIPTISSIKEIIK